MRNALILGAESAVDTETADLIAYVPLSGQLTVLTSYHPPLAIIKQAVVKMRIYRRSEDHGSQSVEGAQQMGNTCVKEAHTLWWKQVV